MFGAWERPTPRSESAQRQGEQRMFARHPRRGILVEQHVIVTYFTGSCMAPYLWSLTFLNRSKHPWVVCRVYKGYIISRFRV